MIEQLNFKFRRTIECKKRANNENTNFRVEFDNSNMKQRDEE